MITPIATEYPQVVITTAIPHLAAIDSGGCKIVRAPVRTNDPNQTIGIFADDQNFVQNSREMIGTPSAEPTLTQYKYNVQGLIAHTDREVGLSTSYTLARYIDMMLYQNPGLLLQLGQLVVVRGSKNVRFQRLVPISTSYQQTSFDKKFLFMSTSSFLVEVETT